MTNTPEPKELDRAGLEALLPCPFCGAPAEIDMSRGFRALREGTLHSGVAIYCSGYCHIDLMLSRADLPEYDNDQLLAILTENWNRRAAPQPQVLGEAVEPDDLLSLTRAELIARLEVHGRNGALYAVEIDALIAERDALRAQLQAVRELASDDHNELAALLDTALEANKALMAERSSMISTHREQLAALGAEAFTLRNQLQDARKDAAKWLGLHDAQEERAETAEQERDALREQLAEAEDAENQTKDLFWAIYPEWCELKGHGLATEAARTMLADRATTAEALASTETVRADKAEAALRPFAAYITARDVNDAEQDDTARVMAYAPEFRGDAVELTFGDFRLARKITKETSNAVD